MLRARFGPFVLDSSQRTLSRAGSGLHLTPKAFDLLVILIGEAPRVVPKAELHARVWPGTFVSDATLVGLVKELRRALDEGEKGPSYIRTAHRVGYAFAQFVAAGAGERDDARRTSHWLVVGSRPVALVPGDNLVGRDPSATVQLDSPGVSRVHARIVISDAGATIQDLGSKNGTKVRGERVVGRMDLRDGDRVDVGPIRVLYRASTRGVSTETVSVPSPDQSVRPATERRRR
jgi:DNA-binding winged helix-turn-helix (wHTH) protein